MSMLVKWPPSLFPDLGHTLTKARLSVYMVSRTFVPCFVLATPKFPRIRARGEAGMRTAAELKVVAPMLPLRPLAMPSGGAGRADGCHRKFPWYDVMP